MRYGQLFNKLEYNGYTIADITHRFKMVSSLSQYSTVMFRAPIEHNDTPESVSLRAYGTTDYWWLVLAINEIIDPLFDWLMSDEEVTMYVDKLYGAEADSHHHYVDSEGNIIDLVYGQSRPTPGIDPHLFQDAVEQIIDPSFAAGYYEQLYMEYLPDPTLRSGDEAIPSRWVTQNLMPVTNVEFFMQENDKKRTVNLVQKQYVDQIIDEMRIASKLTKTQFQETS